MCVFFIILCGMEILTTPILFHMSAITNYSFGTFYAPTKASAGVNLGNVVSLLGGAAPHSSSGGSVSGGASSTIGKRRRKVAYSSSFKEPPSSSITGTFKSGVAAAAMAYCEAMHHLYIPNP